MNFKVSNVSYFLVCNADRTLEGFFGEMKFCVIPYEWNDSWITEKLEEMLKF